MKESKTLVEEAKRIHWRQQILSGRYGDKALKRLVAMTTYGYSERMCV